MLTRADVTPVTIAAATALAAGMAFGVWAGLPGYMAEPAFRAEPQAILADDPNLARYKQVIAEQGGPGPLYFATAYAPLDAAPAEPDPAAQMDAQIARDQAASEQQAKAWEAEREAWLERRRVEQQNARTLPVAYAEPAAAVGQRPPEPETATTDEVAPG